MTHWCWKHQGLAGKLETHSDPRKAIEEHYADCGRVKSKKLIFIGFTRIMERFSKIKTVLYELVGVGNPLEE